MTSKLVEGNLKLSLYAGSVLVAESADPFLWQKVLAEITKRIMPSTAKDEIVPDDIGSVKFSDEEDETEKSRRGKPNSGGVAALAQQLNLTLEQVEAACAPSLEPPYIQLDPQYWEALRKRIPARGPNAISNISFAATLLCLWFKKGGIEQQPSIPDCQNVLKTLSQSMVDANPARSLKNASWLQMRSKAISINPTEMTKAIDVAKSYCVKNYDAKAA